MADILDVLGWVPMYSEESSLDSLYENEYDSEGDRGYIWDFDPEPEELEELSASLEEVEMSCSRTSSNQGSGPCVSSFMRLIWRSCKPFETTK
ncbi:unnamed protein product [Leptidea sinapis]|uniref:Uncharacterized protein n=1 Tax=Leptidea sinapis TaxID=189913 RepID=A0A5E4PVQ4_9NEOP|nr:unnamed protein product [Leptidea sinapis]